MARIDPVPLREWPKEMRTAMDALSPPNPRHPYPVIVGDNRPKALSILGILANYPALAVAFHTFNGHVLYQTALSERHREMVTMRTTLLRNSEYEWRQHQMNAQLDAGMTREEIAMVKEGPDAPGWSPVEAAMLRAVDELVATATITDETWNTMVTEFSQEQLMDVIFTVGAYETLSFMANAVGLQLDPDLIKNDLLVFGD